MFPMTTVRGAVTDKKEFNQFQDSMQDSGTCGGRLPSESRPWWGGAGRDATPG
jgi:hypothetical protein